VALTGYGAPEDRQRALEAGFDAHMVKPVDPDTLAEVLATSSSTRPESVPR
jgi:CheY-like chemotaxis protein